MKTQRKRLWDVAYGIFFCGELEPFATDTVCVAAPTQDEAHERAIAWAHDNDFRCDERIEYIVKVLGCTRAKDDPDTPEPPFA